MTTPPFGRVLVLGNGESHHIGAFFKRALAERGASFAFHDESPYITPASQSLWHRGWHRAIGRRLGQRRYNEDLLALARRFRPEITVVTKGAFVRPDVLQSLKEEQGTILLNFATDDPFNPRSSSPEVLAAIPLYDAYFSTKRAIMGDLRRAGARHVVWMPFAYEPSLHFPERPANPEEAERWASEVVFIGGCDEDRVPFFIPLAAQRDLRLRLHGGYWGKYPQLRNAWHGFALGREYRLALAGSKIAPCLVRRANRDGHVMRTFEVPACGAFLLAERTEEHLELFEEGKEMACFSTPEELLDKVRFYLVHDAERRRMAAAGHRRVTEGANTYGDRLVEMLRVGEALRGGPALSFA